MRKLRDVLDALDRAEADDRPTESRSDARRVRQGKADALLELARTMADMTKRQISKVALSEDLRDVVFAARSIESFTARNRQLKVVRKVLRGEDWEAVQRSVDGVLSPGGAPPPPVSKEDAAVSAWVERLLREGDEGLQAFLAVAHSAERGPLRQLLRSASGQKSTPESKKLLEKALKKALTDSGVDG